MVGQGSPHNGCLRSADGLQHRKCPFRLARAECSRWVGCFLVLLLAAHVFGQEELDRPDEEPAVTLRLRVAWGGGAARRWQGQFVVSNGQLSELAYLGLEADECATLFIDSDTVRIAHRSGRDYDGFDVLVTAPLTATLSLDLTPQEQPQEMRRMEVPLGDLVNGYYHTELDKHGNQLLVQRTGNDVIRITAEQAAPFFSPGDVYEFTVSPHQLGLPPSTNLRFRSTLRAVGQETVVWETESDVVVANDGSVPSIDTISCQLPEAEGVYDLSIELYRRRFGDALVPGKPLHTRQLQLVVLSTDPPPTDSGPWTLVDQINPSQTSWKDWLAGAPKLPLLPGFGQQRLDNGRSHIEQRAGRAMMKLQAGGWQAYPLPIAATDQPHILDVEYPADMPQTLGISIVEPDAVGKVVPIGLDSGVDVGPQWSDPSINVKHHRLIFWPRTATPFVLLTDRRSNQAAMFGAIRIYAGPRQLAPLTSTAALEQSKVGLETGHERMLAAYFDKPLFPENFCARQSADRWTNRSLKDWRTFHDGGRRLVEYLRHTGYNSAVLSVVCQGGTIYPSKYLQPTPKYDTGAFYSDGRNPTQKDVLELLFRLFDRHGLQLMPMVQFAAPLPELEQLRRDDPAEFTGVELVDEQGNSWAQRFGTNRGMAPYYNPLDSRTQLAMRHIIQEIAQRYGRHPSFAGISLQLGPESYALFPGAEWGKDELTMGRFNAQTTTQQGADADARSTRSRDRNEAWLRWRAGLLARFYHDMLDDIRTVCPEGRLLLAGADVLVSPALQPALSPTIPNRLDLSEALLTVGLDLDRLPKNGGITLLRPDRISPQHDAARRAVNLNVSFNPNANTAFSKLDPAGSLFFHEPLPLPLPSFDTASPFGRENTQMLLFTQPTPSDAENRRRFVHRLALQDTACMVDGGWMLAMGQEAAVQSLFQVFTQLPAGGFETVRPKSASLPTQPLVVRQRVESDRTLVYLLNDSPWSVSAELDMKAPVDCRPEPLGNDNAGRMDRVGAQPIWSVELEPYGLVAASFPTAQLKIETWRVTVDRTVYPRLRQAINDVRDRVAELRRSSALDVLANPGFEETGERIPGWEHAQRSGISVTQEVETQVEGNASLRITSQGPVAWVRSNWFPPPATGRIAIMARIKTTGSQKPPLRVAAEGRLANGAIYYKPADVTPLTGQWPEQPFVMLVADLPVEGMTGLRVGFDLMGPGEVWVDEVRVYDKWFLENERDELMILSAVAASSLNKGKIRDCHRILTGYWPQFLMQYITPTHLRTADRSGSDGFNSTQPAAPPAGTDSPSMLDKVKQRIPSRLFPFR